MAGDRLDRWLQWAVRLLEALVRGLTQVLADPKAEAADQVLSGRSRVRRVRSRG